MKISLLMLCALVIAFSASAQPTQTFSHGDPTSDEQLMLEMINRARANPAEEGVRLMETDDQRVQSAYSYFGINKSATKQAFTAYAQKPPLAFHSSLINAARGHSVDMDDRNFQGHTSSNGDQLATRLSKVGYASQGTYGENVAAYSESVWHGHCGLNVDWGAENQVALGHRTNIMNISNYMFTEVGIGILKNDQGLQTGHVGPYVITQDFGVRSVRYLLGVVYNDKNSNGFYDVGEGLAGVMVKPNKGTYYAVTSTSGGYAIPFTSAGSVTITATDGGLSSPVVKTVDFANENLKVDFIPASQGPGAITLTTPANNATGRPLVSSIVWTASPLADSYQWQVSLLQNFSTVLLSGSTPTTSAEIIAPACNTRYYWRVRGVNSIGNGSWSTPFAFTTGGKNPTSTVGAGPKGISTVDNRGTINFSWSTSSDAATYHLRVKSAQAPYPVLYEDSSVIGLSSQVAGSAFTSGNYTWEVRGRNACGASGWSTPVSFSLTVTSVADVADFGWGLSVAPHPLTENSTFTLLSPTDGRVQVSITDLSGATLDLGWYQITTGTSALPLQSLLPQTRGLYVLRVEHDGVMIARMRVLNP